MKRIKLMTTLLILFISATSLTGQRPTIFLIGDSTVKNGKGDGADSLWGWGAPIAQYFDTTRIIVRNEALGGTSSRTFQTKGLWKAVLDQIKKDDYVLIAFGHNDSSPINDDKRARGTIPGIGEETVEIDNILTKEHETVHSFGWYIRKMVNETKEKGATPIIISQTPRNEWIGGNVVRASESYGKWAGEIAEQTGIPFIDLNGLVANKYERLGAESVKIFFPKDHTHTNWAGAELNAQTVIEAIKATPDCDLSEYCTH
jgi:rhamnogalacturonan acetylesterase